MKRCYDCNQELDYVLAAQLADLWDAFMIDQGLADKIEGPVHCIGEAESFLEDDRVVLCAPCMTAYAKGER
jgi:hypothetical protein